MNPTKLNDLINEEGIVFLSNGMKVTAKLSWVLKGEDRLSYTTIIRLVECCREYHWNKDILRISENKSLDSITKSLSCDFLKPILVGGIISITYTITKVKNRSYSLRFEILDAVNQTPYATIDVISVFYDPTEHISIVPPISVIDYLTDYM